MSFQFQLKVQFISKAHQGKIMCACKQALPNVPVPTSAFQPSGSRVKLSQTLKCSSLLSTLTRFSMVLLLLLLNFVLVVVIILMLSERWGIKVDSRFIDIWQNVYLSACRLSIYHKTVANYNSYNIYCL